VAIGDLDGDSNLDLAVTNMSDDNVSIFLGKGDGIFQAAVNLGVHTVPRSVAIADLEGDGDQDLVAGNEESDDVSVLINLGVFIPSSIYLLLLIP
jgi:hypothetical protein